MRYLSELHAEFADLYGPGDEPASAERPQLRVVRDDEGGSRETGWPRAERPTLGWAARDGESAARARRPAPRHFRR